MIGERKLRYRQLYVPPDISILDLPTSTMVPVVLDARYPVVIPPIPPRDDADDPPVRIACPRCHRLIDSESHDVLWCTTCRHIFITDSSSFPIDHDTRPKCPECSADVSDVIPTFWSQMLEDSKSWKRQRSMMFCQSCGVRFRLRDMNVQCWEHHLAIEARG